MKKLISALICFILIIGSVIPSFAVGCIHIYEGELFSANCLDREHTVYTCAECGDSYKAYTEDFTEPEGFCLLLSSVRVEDKLIVSIYLYNNPGIQAAQVTVDYNRSALQITETQAGEIWDSKKFANSMSWNPEASHITFFADDAERTVKSGLFATVTFNVTDDSADYGVSHRKSLKAFVDWDDTANKVVERVPTVINIVGKNELGHHEYKNGVCIFCDEINPDSYILTLDGTEIRYSAGEEVFLENAENYIFEGKRIRFVGYSGDIQYLTGEMPATQSFNMPACHMVLTSVYKTVGDADGDGIINTADYNQMKRALVGAPYDIIIDIDNNGILNSTDMNLYKRMMIGQYVPAE